MLDPYSNVPGGIGFEFIAFIVLVIAGISAIYKKITRAKDYSPQQDTKDIVYCKNCGSEVAEVQKDKLEYHCQCCGRFIDRWGNKLRSDFYDDEKVVISCPQCGQRLNVPKAEHIYTHCPKCDAYFDYKQ